MKIQAAELGTKKPLMNTKIQLQVKGKDSGFITVTTDAKGIFELEDKFRGQQISCFLQGTSSSGQAITATEGATLFVPKQTESVQSGMKGTTTFK